MEWQRQLEEEAANEGRRPPPPQEQQQQQRRRPLRNSIILSSLPSSTYHHCYNHQQQLSPITWISISAQNPSMSLQSLNENGSQVLSRIWSCIRGDEEANGIGFAIGVDLCEPQSRIIHKPHNVCKPQRMNLCNNKDKSTIGPPFLDGWYMLIPPVYGIFGLFFWSPVQH